MLNQNVGTTETPLVIALLTLLISPRLNDRKELKARINALGLADFVGAMRTVQKLERPLIEYG
jgi:hypothetical protein